MKKIILFFLLFPAILFAENSFIIAIDGTFFKHDDDLLRWEFYYSFPDYTINYKQEKEYFSGAAKLDLKIYSKDILKQSLDWKVPNYIKTMADTNLISLFGIKSFVLPPGQYKVQFKVVDLNDTNNYSLAEFEIFAPKLNNKNLSLGGMMLASYITNSDSSSPHYDEMFLRFDKYLFPNPSLEIYGAKTRIIAYAEIYNALAFAEDGFNLTYSIGDAVKSTIWSQTKEVESIDDFMTEFVDFTLDSLHTGAYFLGIKASYPKKKPTDSVMIYKKIFVINPDLKPLIKQYFSENQLFEKSVFNAMSPEEINIQIKMARIISNPFEIEQIDDLSETDGKRRFLLKYWLEKDPDTTSYVNERYQEFMGYVEYATNYMSYTVGDGWSTERGKIILRYGIPTERKQFVEDLQNRPYEEWFYENVQGGVNFYFVDKTYSGNFFLVHSTARHEAYNPNWYNDFVIPAGEIRTGSQESIYPNVPNR